MDCDRDPIDALREMFVEIIQRGRIRLGQNPALRAAFSKPHGVAHGWFEVRADLPEPLRVGVFKQDRLQAWTRFSSDVLPSVPDLQTFCGVAIKLFGVSGPKLLDEGDTQDFIFQNHDVFFVDTAADLCKLLKASLLGDATAYLDKHPVTKRIIEEMKKAEASALTATYWSALPSSFGDRHVKYKLEPEAGPDGLPFDDPNYLAIDFQRRLLAGEVRFRFMIQLQTHRDRMPLDQATVRWDETESVPIHVATLVLPRQDVATLGQAAYGENLSWNLWHSLAEHRPWGSLADARRVVYAASAAQRRKANGIPSTEPGEPRSPAAALRDRDSTIVKAAVYPAIGIARLGNSEGECFIGPEVTEPLPKAAGFYRDPDGALKRQAARFRIYGLNADGKAVRELNSSNGAKIHWAVQLANKKSAWYQFQIPLDIPEAASAPLSLLRNATVSDRTRLMITPRPRTIFGENTRGEEHSFDDGKFMDMDKRVYLGELRTDDKGRLIVLGGLGKAASFDGSLAIDYGNNEGWHDDISDGPVTATVYFEGQTSLPIPLGWLLRRPTMARGKNRFALCGT